MEEYMSRIYSNLIIITLLVIITSCVPRNDVSEEYDTRMVEHVDNENTDLKLTDTDDLIINSNQDIVQMNPHNDHEQIIIDTSYGLNGNSSINLSNNGFIASDQNYIYLNPNEKFYPEGKNINLIRFNKDDGTINILSNEYISSINLDSQYIYYVSSPTLAEMKLNGNVIRIDKAGANRTVLFSGDASNLSLYKDKLYFINRADNNFIYSINIDGNNLMRVTEKYCESMYLDQHNLIAVSKSSDVVHINLDTMEKIEISSIGEFQQAYLVKEYFYYLQKGEVLRYSIIQQIEEKIYSMTYIDEFIIIDNSIVAQDKHASSSKDEDGKTGHKFNTYIFELDGSNVRESPFLWINDERVYFIGLTPKYIYYLIFRSEYPETVRMNLNTFQTDIVNSTDIK